jgi:hypothetical protein
MVPFQRTNMGGRKTRPAPKWRYDMDQRLMTPFCFASILAAALIAEGAIAGVGAKAAPAATGRAEAPARVGAVEAPEQRKAGAR